MSEELHDEGQDVDLLESTGGAQHEEEHDDGEGAGGGAGKNDEMRTALAELATTVKDLAKPKPEEPKQLSPEELEELWAVYNPEKDDPDFFKKWMRLQADADPNEVQSTVAERKKLFAMMQKGLVRQSVVGAKNLFDAELQKVHETYKPLLDYVNEQKAEKTRQDFYGAYPALKDARFAKVVAATAKTLDGQDFKSNKDYFKALAESAAETIKGIIPDFELGAVKREEKPTGTTPRLPRGRAGGTGGTGGGQRQASDTSKSGDIDELD